MITLNSAFEFDQDADPNEPRIREAKIAGEICARLIEWKGIASRDRVAKWLEAVRFSYRQGTGLPPAPNGSCDRGRKVRDEIAERLSEWASDAGGRARARRWLNMLGGIWSAGSSGPSMLWLYIAFQTGDARQIAASFEERGEAKAVPRQAAHQEFATALASLRQLSPPLALALRELYERHSPEAAAAGGMVATGENVLRGS